MALPIAQFALFRRDDRNRLGVGTVIGVGRRYATIETVFRRRVAKVRVLGLFATEYDALVARDNVEAVDPWDLLAQRSAVKQSTGYSEMPK